MDRRETEPDNGKSFARELCLVRRRSRLPWVYSVYHRPPTTPGCSAGLTGWIANTGVEFSPVETARPAQPGNDNAAD
jgi:hypothetical protein